MAAITNGPSTLDWTIYAGDANLAHFAFKQSGLPWDLTGAQLLAQARVTALDTTVALTAVITEVNAAAGQYDIAWPGELVRTAMAGAASWSAVWDLQVLENGQTLPTTMLRGKLSAVMDVTRSTG
jgi:hypothetical protein